MCVRSRRGSAASWSGPRPARRCASCSSEITTLIERQRPGHMKCSLLLLDREHGCVRHGAAPSLPAEFVHRIDGSRIGPQAGSCGTAAYLGERVIVEDIATHPAWVDYRDFALPHGLRACWSSPIFSSSHDVLGTFAMYYREPRGPDAADLELVEHATHLAAVAIQRDRAEAALRKNMLMRQIVFDGVVDVLFSIDVDAQGAFRFQCVNQAFTRATGPRRGRRRRPPRERRHPRAVVRRGARALSNVHPRAQHRSAGKRSRCFRRERGTGCVSISPVFDGDGVCTTLVGTVHDVTESRAAEERIRYQAALLDRANDAIVVRDLDGTVRYWNQGAARVYGWTAAEAVGRPVTELLYRDTGTFERAQRQVIDLRQLEGGARAATQRWGRADDRRELDVAARPGRRAAVGAGHQHRRHRAKEGRAAPLARAAHGEPGPARGRHRPRLQQRPHRHPRERDAWARLEAAPGAASVPFFEEIENAGARATALVRQILTFTRDQAPKREPVSLPAIVEESLRLAARDGAARDHVRDRDRPRRPGDPRRVDASSPGHHEPLHERHARDRRGQRPRLRARRARRCSSAASSTARSTCCPAPTRVSWSRTPAPA